MMGLQNPIRLTRRNVGDELTMPLDLNVTGRPLDQRGARESLHVELANRHDVSVVFRAELWWSAVPS